MNICTCKNVHDQYSLKLNYINHDNNTCKCVGKCRGTFNVLLITYKTMHRHLNADRNNLPNSGSIYPTSQTV